jgi:S1-C subfamily serine protease
MTKIKRQAISISGIGFVIPSAIVTKVVPSLISSGTYQHPWLGITGITLTPDIASQINLPATQHGALVVDVDPNGPAAQAGVIPSQASNDGQISKGGDVITRVDEQPVKQFEDLGAYMFFNKKPGDTVTLTVLRSGKEQKVQVTLGSLPNP